jgi:hypothetical protein
MRYFKSNWGVERFSISDAANIPEADDGKSGIVKSFMKKRRAKLFYLSQRAQRTQSFCRFTFCHESGDYTIHGNSLA